MLSNVSLSLARSTSSTLTTGTSALSLSRQAETSALSACSWQLIACSSWEVEPEMLKSSQRFHFHVFFLSFQLELGSRLFVINRNPRMALTGLVVEIESAHSTSRRLPVKALEEVRSLVSRSSGAVGCSISMHN
jgi:hypothetical protein